MRLTQQLQILGLLLLSTGCAATVDRDKTMLIPMDGSVRLDPPRAGQNEIYVEFRDVSASGLEDRVRERLEEAVEDRGWKLVDDFYEAKYVLWADLRLLGEAGTEAGDQALNRLGAIAAGAAVGVGVAQVTDNWWVGVATGVVAGSAAEKLLEHLTRVTKYQMAVDLVLGRKVEGGVTSRSEVLQGSELGSNTQMLSDLGSEQGSNSRRLSIEQQIVEKRVHFDLAQRLVLFAEGRRMSKQMAIEEFIPKLVEGLKSQLPRVR